MENVQALFDRSAGPVFTLPPGEHQGPLVIRRSCTVEGAGATLWAAAGPVLVVEAPQVKLRKLRVEVIGRQTEKKARTAVEFKAAGGHADRLEVAGSVRGLPGESEDWSLPRVIDLGSFAAGEDNSFALELWLPQEARLENLMDGVSLSPLQLTPGLNRLTLHTGEISDNTILYGELLLVTEQAVRRVYVKGEAVAGAARQKDAAPRRMEPRQLIHAGAEQAKPPATAQPAGRKIDTTRPPRRTAATEGTASPAGGRKIDTTRPPRRPAATEGTASPAGSRKIDTTRPPRRQAPHEAAPSAGEGTLLVRGQRLALERDSFTMRYTDAGHPAGVDLNCFVFCLDAAGRAQGDESLVFFNHAVSADGAVRISQTAGLPQVEVDLSKAAADITRFVVSLGLYEPPSGLTLGSLRSPQLTLEAGGRVLYRLPLDGLRQELVVNAVELYRYQNAWRLSFVNAGYAAGLARLCRDYGLQVE